MKSEVLFNSIFLILCGGLILLIFTPVSFIFGKTISKYWIPFVLHFLGYSLYNCFAFFCRGTNRTKLFAIQGIVLALLTAGLNVVFLIVFKWGVSGYLFAIIISYFITIIFVILSGKLWVYIIGFKLNISLLKEMLKYSLPMVPTMVAWWINSSADKYIIISMLGLGVSGIYSVAHKIPSILTVVTEIFNQAWQISAILNYKNNENHLFYSSICNFFTIACVFACSILIIASEMIGHILFAKEYLVAWEYVPPLLVAALYSSLSGFLASIFRMAKKTKILFVSTCIGAVFNIVFNYVGIFVFGAMGAAYVTMLSFILVWIIRLKCSRKIIKLNIKWSNLVISMGAVIIQSILFCNVYRYRYIIGIICIIIITYINISDIWQIKLLIGKLIREKVLKQKDR
jgi:O-antigen/teichoic acid export membrane protein